MKKFIFILAVIFTFTMNVFTQPIIIPPGTTIWNTNRTVCGEVIILSGATLTITNCTVSFCPNVGITALTGGRLIINNATLTNATVNVRWNGVNVTGNSSLYPGHPNQNGVQMDKGTIQNTNIGIDASSSAYVRVTESNFINNEIGVYFRPLYGPIGVSGTFRQTTFSVTSGYFGAPFNTHIKAELSGTLQVRGCNFYGTNTLNSSNLNRGIEVLSTPLLVTEYCFPGSAIEMPSGKCTNAAPSFFMGLNHGIIAINTGTNPALDVKFSTFLNNLYGVTVNAINNNVLWFNDFYSYSPSSYGAYITDATGYIIQENKFTGNLGVTTTGLNVSESGSAENRVYRNKFTTFAIGQHFMGRNSLQGVSNITGLQTLCNEFYGTQRDILVAGSLTFSLPSIRKDQGTSRTPAGNRFTPGATVNFESQSSFSIDYHYGTDPAELPVVFGLINLLPTYRERSCPMGSNPPDERNALIEYDELNSEYEYWLDKLLAAEIGGEEYDVILNEVSYYSGLKDNLFNSIIAAALCEEETLDEKKKIENLRYLFTYRGSYTDYLGLTETYLSERDYSEAMVTLSKMYERFEVTEEQVIELKGLETYTLWLQQLEKEERSIYKLSDKEIAYLVNFVATNTGRGAVFAKNILCALYNICPEKAELPEFSIPQNQIEESVIDPAIFTPNLQIDDKTLLDKITVAPNPTTGELSIMNYELQVEKIEVLDIVGRIVSSHHLSTSSFHHKIDISHLNNSIYFVKIITEQGEIVKRIVKQ